MDYTIFASSIGRIKSLENKLLDRAKLESLTEARDFEDAVRLLQDTRYGTYTSGPDYEAGLRRALTELYGEMYKTSPVREVVDILALRYVGHNIKSLIKAKLSGIGHSNLLIDAGNIPPKALEAMVDEENFRDMPGMLRESVEKAIEGYKNTLDPQGIDITIDKGIYRYMLEMAKRSDMEYLRRITELFIDIANLKAFIRIKLQDRDREFMRNVFLKGGRIDFDVFANNINDSLESFPGRVAHTDYYKWVKSGIDEYLKTGDLGAVERYGDNYIIEFIRKSKLSSFGPEHIMAYIIAVENEIRAVRIVLTGKKNNVAPGLIRERLRDTYV